MIKNPAQPGQREKKKNPHRGSSFDDFLKEEGIYEVCSIGGLKQVLKWQIEANVPFDETLESLNEFSSAGIIFPKWGN